MSFTENFVTPCNGWKLDLFDDDGDAHLEIVVSEHYSTPCRLLLYKNNGAEVFSEIVIDPDLGSNPEGAGEVRCADFDGDGDIDIVACGRNYWMAWYANDGAANFTEHI